MNHLVACKDLTPERIFHLIARAKQFRNTPARQLHHLKACNIFFEESTRTRCSFELAQKNLGMRLVTFDPKVSSLTKGEHILDTLYTLSAIGVNLAVVRHSDDTILDDLQGASPVKLVNAGTGRKEHPTQALLDLLTMSDYFELDKLQVAICGDIRFGRVARSQIQVLNTLGITPYICGPDILMPREGDRNFQGLKFRTATLDEVIPEVNVLMMLRIQRERHQELDVDASTYLNAHGLSMQRYRKLRPEAKILHPGPFNRGVEIDPEIIHQHNSLIFKQVQNGVHMRMAVLEALATEN